MKKIILLILTMLLIPYMIIVFLTKDNNQINIPTRRIDCELISMKEMRERLGIPEEVKVQEIEQDTNKEEITQEVKEKEPLIIRYGYVKNNTNLDEDDLLDFIDSTLYKEGDDK